MLKYFLSVAIVFGFTGVFAQTRVYLIPTLHGMHRTNEQYNYDSLKAIVARLKPDVIAVEIRHEDMSGDSVYLKKNYPDEMWMMRYWFPDIKIEGFDWLGTELQGRSIPDNYWRDSSAVKRMERLLEIDTTMKNKVANCQLYVQERMKLLTSGSLKEILNSALAIVTRTYFDCLGGQLQGTDYAVLSRFYNRRNTVMRQRLDCIVKAHPDKTIVVLTGDDHYPYLLEHFRKTGVAVLNPYADRSLTKKPF